MITNSKSPIEKMVDRLFVEMNAKRGDLCVNPVTSGHFVWGDDPLAPQKREAVAALRAREWFAVNGPADAPPLPISYNEVERYREARGLVLRPIAIQTGLRRTEAPVIRRLRLRVDGFKHECVGHRKRRAFEKAFPASPP